MPAACSATRSASSSATDASTNSREPATHACPWLKKIPPNAPLVAASRSASANTMFGLLPPSSSVTRFSPSTAVRMISLPVAV